jgi:hypothetical protein
LIVKKKRNPHPELTQAGPIRRVDIAPDGARKSSSLGYHERTASAIPWLLAWTELQPAVAVKED